MQHDSESHLGVTVRHSGGATFRVWAPFASSVAVTGDFNNWSQSANLLTRDQDDSGCWSGFVDNAEVGQEYKFVIRNGDQVMERNDPRALQMTAAQDASVIVDPHFNWENDNFNLPPSNQQVIYELHPGTFYRPDPATPGTFQDVITKLDHLQQLGINVIELMPVSGTNMERWWGYEPSYLYAVESAYGGRKAFLELVKAAHQRGIGVIVDVVYNHLTPAAGFDLWQFDGWSKDGKGGIYFYNDWRGDSPWGPRPDYGRPEVRQFITDNVKMWLNDCHIDGIRADAVFAIRNAKGWNNDPEHDIPEGWQLLQEITTVARQIKPQANLIAEDVACNDYITKPVDQGGAGFNAQWETTFPNTLRAILKPVHDHDRHLQALVDALQKSYNGDAFGRVIFSESHDADANGQARLNEEITPGQADDIYARRRSTLGAALALTTPGVPMLFQGQEFMESGWFTHWRALDWSKAERHHGILQLYRDLIALRLNHHGFSRGLTGSKIEILHLDETDGVLAFHRRDQGGAGDDVIVALNFSNQAHLNLNIHFPHPGTWKVRFNSDWHGYSPDFDNTPTPDVAVEQDQGAINLGPYSVIILSQDPN